MNDMILLPIPKETVSDDSVLLVRWLVDNHAAVRQGTGIAVIETSKSSMDVDAPADGFLHHLAEEGTRVRVGANFAAITASAESPTVLTPANRLAAADAARPIESRFSKAAWQLVRKHQLAPEAFGQLPFVRQQDVEAHLRGKAGGGEEIVSALPPPRATDVVIWGGGGHGKVCIEIVRAMKAYTIYGIVDAQIPVGSSVLDIPVIGRESALEELRRRGVNHAILGIGAASCHASRREKLARLEQAGYALPNIIHPNATLDRSVTLGNGSVVFANATVSSDVRIGSGCIVNSGVVVSHDCIVEDNVHLAPGALLAGGVRVGSDTLVGMGAMVFMGVRIGRGVQINNGVVLNADVGDAAVVKA